MALTSSSVSSSVARRRNAASASSMSRARSTVRWSRPSRSSGAGEPMKTSNGSVERFSDEESETGVRTGDCRTARS
ncbi:hypothetical protein SMICM304S_07935 [Streptomyces microflavus]